MRGGYKEKLHTIAEMAASTDMEKRERVEEERRVERERERRGDRGVCE